MTQNKTNTNAFLIHISAFAGFIFPFGDIVTPLIAWQTLKDRNVILDEQGKEAVNFNISYSLYIFILTLTFIPFVLGNIFRHKGFFENLHQINWHFDSSNFFGFLSFASVAGLIGIVKIVLTIIAAIKAKEGENYKYPFTIKFIK